MNRYSFAFAESRWTPEAYMVASTTFASDRFSRSERLEPGSAQTLPAQSLRCSVNLPTGLPNTRVKLPAPFLQGRIAFVMNDPVRRSLRARR